MEKYKNLCTAINFGNTNASTEYFNSDEELKNAVDTALSYLDMRSRDIVMASFGFCSTPEQVCDTYHITVARARYVEAKALRFMAQPAFMLTGKKPEKDSIDSLVTTYDTRLALTRGGIFKTADFFTLTPEKMKALQFSRNAINEVLALQKRVAATAEK